MVLMSDAAPSTSAGILGAAGPAEMIGTGSGPTPHSFSPASRPSVPRINGFQFVPVLDAWKDVRTDRH